MAAITTVCFRVSNPSTSTRLPPEKGLRSSGAIPRSAPESKSKISPDAFLATSIAKIPTTVMPSQKKLMRPPTAAAHAPRKIEAMEASEILGSAKRQKPAARFALGDSSIVHRTANQILPRHTNPKLRKSFCQCFIQGMAPPVTIRRGRMLKNGVQRANDLDGVDWLGQMFGGVPFMQQRAFGEPFARDEDERPWREPVWKFLRDFRRM